MDLLGSILSSMDKPPTVSDKQKALIKSKSSHNLQCRFFYAEANKNLCAH